MYYKVNYLNSTIAKMFWATQVGSILNSLSTQGIHIDFKSALGILVVAKLTWSLHVYVGSTCWLYLSKLSSVTGDTMLTILSCGCIYTFYPFIHYCTQAYIMIAYERLCQRMGWLKVCQYRSNSLNKNRKSSFANLWLKYRTRLTSMLLAKHSFNEYLQLNIDWQFFCQCCQLQLHQLSWLVCECHGMNIPIAASQATL